jgi:ribosomal protein S18 acetylase RimI-like enzyme
VNLPSNLGRPHAALFMKMASNVTISAARDGNALKAVTRLGAEFLKWNHARYASLPWLIERYYDPSAWESYMSQLHRLYGPPNGEILLARQDSEPVGCVMMRALDERACEMKHLFVGERAQGQGVGSRLCRTLMSLAAERGFVVMRLETGVQNHEALGLYRYLGFAPCAPNTDYPDDVRPFVHCLAADLTA